MSLPEPSFIDCDPGTITAELIAAYETATGRTLYPAQVERLLIDLIAYRETLIRIAVQEAAKQNLVAYAVYPMLDHLGDLVGVTRLSPASATCTLRFTLTAAQTFDVEIPAGTRVESKDGAVIFATDSDLTIPAASTTGDATATCETAGTAGNGYAIGEINNLLDVINYVSSAANTDETTGGDAEETDDAFRARIQLAPERFSNAGSVGAYEYWAKSAHQSIVDVAVLSPEPGRVAIYPLTETGAPSAAILAAVEAVCSADDVRPLTDGVDAIAPAQIGYTIDATIILYEAADAASVTTLIETALETYLTTQRAKLGADIVRSQLIAVINNVSGVYSTTLTSPAADVVVAANEWAAGVIGTIAVSGTTAG